VPFVAPLWSAFGQDEQVRDGIHVGGEVSVISLLDGGVITLFDAFPVSASRSV
jgi:hypothetical protein